MEFELGNIKELSHDNLLQLPAAISAEIKRTKKRINVLLKNNKDLMSSWLGVLAPDSQKIMPDEIKEIRNKRKLEFEMKLLLNPEAFVAFQTENFLVKLLSEIRSEKIRRETKKNEQSICP
jgi:hypothetical protein